MACNCVMFMFVKVPITCGILQPKALHCSCQKECSCVLDDKVFVCIVICMRTTLGIAAPVKHLQSDVRQTCVCYMSLSIFLRLAFHVRLLALTVTHSFTHSVTKSFCWMASCARAHSIHTHTHVRIFLNHLVCVSLTHTHLRMLVTHADTPKDISKNMPCKIKIIPCRKNYWTTSPGKSPPEFMMAGLCFPSHNKEQ